MSASTPISTHYSRPQRHSPAATIAIALVAGAAVFGLLISAITFGALAIAFPLAVPIAHQYGVAVSASDAAIAQRFADLWWVFAAVSVASLVAAAVVIVKTVAHLDSPAA